MSCAVLGVFVPEFIENAGRKRGTLQRGHPSGRLNFHPQGVPRFVLLRRDFTARPGDLDLLARNVSCVSGGICAVCSLKEWTSSVDVLDQDVPSHSSCRVIEGNDKSNIVKRNWKVNRMNGGFVSVLFVQPVREMNVGL